MVQLAPSLLSADFLHLGEAVGWVNAHADLFHMDIMDGVFVPNLSFGFPVLEAVAPVARRPLDVHLMIVNPIRYVERVARTGAGMISFHYEAAGERTLETLRAIQEQGVKAGLAINPDCPVERIFPFLDFVDYVLIMSVFAGFGGQKFMQESLTRIRAVRQELDRRDRPDVPIEVDGGVGLANRDLLVSAGASILVAGSSVFGADDPSAAMDALRGIKECSSIV